MGFLIDSDVLIGVERDGTDISSLVRGREEKEMYISVISASELLHGVHRAKNAKIRAARLAFVEGVLTALPLLQIDLAIARSHAQLWSALAASGKMIGVQDSWLAATCLAHGLTLVTGNASEFRRVPGLELELWPPRRD